MTDASEMIERVARKIYGQLGGGRILPPAIPWEELSMYAREEFFLAARAAIQAMREPTDAMGAAGLRVQRETQHLFTTGELTEEERGRVQISDKLRGNPSHWTKPVWRSMIDAALARAPSEKG